jgi:S-ribosylhomocysteine lyase LuxS involved in autoinducer biosynthesis
VAVLWFGLERVIWHIYSLPTEKCGFLINISIAVFSIIGCAAGAYMGFATRYDANSVVNVLNQVETLKEDLTQKMEVTNEDRI